MRQQLLGPAVLVAMLVLSIDAAGVRGSVVHLPFVLGRFRVDRPARAPAPPRPCARPAQHCTRCSLIRRILSLVSMRSVECGVQSGIPANMQDQYMNMYGI